MLVPYCRVSSGRQLDGLSMSIQGDMRLLNELAVKYNTTISDHVFSDEGKSAFKGDNLKGELGKILDYIEKGEIKSGDILVCRALDRLSRQNLTGSIHTYNTIMRAGVLIHTTMDNRLYEPDDQISLLMATLALNTANEESHKKSYLTNKFALTRIEQFQRGEIPDNGTAYDIGVGRHPFYITIENRVIKPHPILFDAMKEAVKLALNGDGIAKIQKFFVENYNHEISYSNAGKTFRSGSLFGRHKVNLEGKDYFLDGYYPKVCTESEFYQIRAIKESRTVANGNRKRVSVLAGHRKTYCDRCGGSVVAITVKKQQYYKCGYQHCFTGIRQAVLDKIALKNMTAHKFQPTQYDYSILSGLEEQHKQATIALVKNRTMILDNLELFGEEGKLKLQNQQSNVDELVKKIEEEKQNIHQHSIAMKSTEKANLLRSNIQTWINEIDKVIANGSDYEREELRGVVQEFVKRITVDGNLIKIELVDGAIKYSYLLKSKMANPRVRYYIDLSVVSEEEYDHYYKQMIDDEVGRKLLLTFTTSDRLDNYECYDDELGKGIMLLATPQTEIIDYKKQFIDIVFKSRPWQSIIWTRKEVLKMGVTTTQWQDYKGIDLSDYGTLYEVYYKTNNYVKKKTVVLTRIKSHTDLKTNLKLILNANKVESLTKI